MNEQPNLLPFKEIGQMKTEYEAKFLNIDPAVIAQMIADKGGYKSKERTLMRRCTFDIPGAERGTFIRVRDEGTKTTLTYKTLRSLDVAGMGELELTVSDFQKAVQFCNAIGLKQATYEENYRTAFALGDAEITIDEWPSVPPFVEVEADSAEIVQLTAQLLGLDMEQAVYGNVDEVYRRVGNIDISKLKTITFTQPPV